MTLLLHDTGVANSYVRYKRLKTFPRTLKIIGAMIYAMRDTVTLLTLFRM